MICGMSEEVNLKRPLVLSYKTLKSGRGGRYLRAGSRGLDERVWEVKLQVLPELGKADPTVVLPYLQFCFPHSVIPWSTVV